MREVATPQSWARASRCLVLSSRECVRRIWTYPSDWRSLERRRTAQARHGGLSGPSRAPETGVVEAPYGWSFSIGARAHAQHAEVPVLLRPGAFRGRPVAFVIFVLGMSLFGVVIGVGLGIAGLILTALKFALMVILPIALLVWVAKRLLAPERTY